jgi:hypothetical protein
MVNETEENAVEVLWPTDEPLDGVMPTRHVSQDPHLFDNDNNHTAVQMEG